MSLIINCEHLKIGFEDIKEATENFTTVIGSGGYGKVYRGKLKLSSHKGKHIVVAVKRLQSVHGQGVKEFLTEIQLLSRYKHQNIVSLVGFCEKGNERFLIYKYARYGSLDHYLKPNIRHPLTWEQRISICIDAASGLNYLHNQVAQNQRVIHRDIKSANILLDHNWKAMIADFGFSKIGRANENESYLITNACGTHGYCDPAYMDTGILTKESDIYSFGVVLLEVLCGRLGFINVNSKERFLAPWAQYYYKEKKLNHIIDQDLNNYLNSHSMKVFSDIAFQCLHDDRKQRPSIALVLKKLTTALKLIKQMPSIIYPKPLAIPFKDIKKATRNFTTLVGRSGHSPVYRGKLSLKGKPIVVAVKRLQSVHRQGVKEKLLSSNKHQNLVSLVGLCEQGSKIFLIYEYPGHGSLDNYLNPKTRCPLTWRQRISICIDAARGLDHLHIHRDIKAENILLDHNWKAMIDSYVITCDPANTDIWVQQYTKESNIYSFGVVLLQVLRGRLCFINLNYEEQFLAPLAEHCYKEDNINLIIDQDLNNYLNSHSMKVFSDITSQCLHDDHKQRPSIALVLERLMTALKWLEMEQAPELLELEEALELKKLVETMQIQVSTFTFVAKSTILCVCLYMQQLTQMISYTILKFILHVVKQFKEMLEIQTSESRIDYEVIKAICDMPNSPLSYITTDKLHLHLSKGILVNEGKVWLSTDDDGKTQEMISAMSCGLESFTEASDPGSRFSKIAKVSLPRDKTQVKVKTQFLSSGVKYAAYLVCKPDLSDAMDSFSRLELLYTLNDSSRTYVSRPIY